MPFKNLTSPRKVNQVDAEVRGQAFLTNPELIALVTNDPVRLVVHPAGGSNGKITNLTLSGGDEVALLSKDVALVRSGDAVWALINIAHQPKMEQVASDIRTLCMRPSGTTALALGWDGSATELTLNKHDVEARTFPLRGDVRACDITATETYVVVDKSDGGELRVHPGGTPEPGANWRTALPKGAASLDRLRAGQKLSAVYKRGAPEVCVVTANGGRLSAKMIRLESAPTDVAVLESSLFAAFPGGRVALYNAEALAGATDSPLAPTASIALGGRGEPRTIGVPTKGAPTLWVGTSGGDVLSVPIVSATSLV